MDIGDPEIDKLGNSQSAAVKCLNDGLIPVPLRLAQINLIDHPFNFGNGEDFRKLKSYFGDSISVAGFSSISPSISRIFVKALIPERVLDCVLAF